MPIIKSSSMPVFTWTNLPAAAGYANKRVRISDVGVGAGSVWFTDGTTWSPEGGSVLLYQSNVTASLIEPAATFTGVTLLNNGGNVQLVSAGVHGLTTSPAVGKAIYVSAGTAWTPGFYTIASVDTTLTFTISLAYSASYGAPTIALANSGVNMTTVAVKGGLMGVNGSIEVIASYTFTTGTNFKTLKTYANATSPIAWAGTNNAAGFRSIGYLHNQNSQAVNLGLYNNSSSSGFAQMANISSLTLNTANDFNVITNITPAVANEFIQQEGLIIKLYRS